MEKNNEKHLGSKSLRSLSNWLQVAGARLARWICVATLARWSLASTKQPVAWWAYRNKSQFHWRQNNYDNYVLPKLCKFIQFILGWSLAYIHSFLKLVCLDESDAWKWAHTISYHQAACRIHVHNRLIAALNKHIISQSHVLLHPSSSKTILVYITLHFWFL